MKNLVMLAVLALGACDGGHVAGEQEFAVSLVNGAADARECELRVWMEGADDVMVPAGHLEPGEERGTTLVVPAGATVYVTGGCAHPEWPMVKPRSVSTVAIGPVTSGAYQMVYTEERTATSVSASVIPAGADAL
ncbi:hypothetical protein [Myxococcus phage Mx4 ts27htf-1hrm-1]|nr:hypothetical protein [Myxococcus phage Mx4 ts27htf-1hrm-1]